MKFLLTAIALSSSVAAFAAPSTVGVLENIKGVVSVSSNGVVNSVVGSTNLVNGSVVINSNNASSFVRLTNGCTVGLKSSQVLTVNAAATCSDLMASVKNVGAPVVMADGDAGFLSTNNVLIGMAVAAGGIIFREATRVVNNINNTPSGAGGGKASGS